MGCLRCPPLQSGHQLRRRSTTTLNGQLASNPPRLRKIASYHCRLQLSQQRTLLVMLLQQGSCALSAGKATPGCLDGGSGCRLPQPRRALQEAAPCPGNAPCTSRQKDSY